MELVILGSGTGIPTANRGAPGYVVEGGAPSASWSMLLDSGPGAVHRLCQAGYSLKEIDHVFYTHLHPDHTADLVALLFALHIGLGRTRPLPITGPPGFSDFFRRLGEVYGDWISPRDLEVEVQEIDPGEVVTPSTGNIPGPPGSLTDGAWRVRAAEVVHTKTSLAYRVEAEGRALVYSGDSGECEALVHLGRGARLMLLECSHPDEEGMPGHLTPGRAGRIAELAGVPRLVLTHFYPDCEGRDLITRCRKEYSGEVILAEDLMRITV